MQIAKKVNKESCELVAMLLIVSMRSVLLNLFIYSPVPILGTLQDYCLLLGIVLFIMQCQVNSLNILRER